MLLVYSFWWDFEIDMVAFNVIRQDIISGFLTPTNISVRLSCWDWKSNPKITLVQRLLIILKLMFLYFISLSSNVYITHTHYFGTWRSRSHFYLCINVWYWRRQLLIYVWMNKTIPISTVYKSMSIFLVI